jgi:hypothetical protein
MYPAGQGVRLRPIMNHKGHEKTMPWRSSDATKQDGYVVVKVRWGAKHTATAHECRNGTISDCSMTGILFFTTYSSDWQKSSLVNVDSNSDGYADVIHSSLL